MIAGLEEAIIKIPETLEHINNKISTSEEKIKTTLKNEQTEKTTVEVAK